MARTGDGSRELLAGLGRCDGISLPGDDECRSLDRREPVAQVEVGQRLAAARISLGRRPDEHRAERLPERVGRERREPPVEGGVSDRGDSVRSYRRRTFQPLLARRQARCRGAEDEAVDPFRCFRGEPHADHPADREAAERGAFDAEVVEQVEGVSPRSSIEYGPGGTGERPCPRRSYRTSLKLRRQRGDLRIPHLQGRPERVAQHQWRSPVRPVEPIVKRHASTSSAVASSRRTRARGRRARPTTRDRWRGRERHRAPRARGRLADRRGARRGSSSRTRRPRARSPAPPLGPGGPSARTRLARPSRGRRSGRGSAASGQRRPPATRARPQARAARRRYAPARRPARPTRPARRRRRVRAPAPATRGGLPA